MQNELRTLAKPLLGVVVEKERHERKYYTQVPHIVRAWCRDVYDLSLWVAIKMIAGEDGRCTLSTPDLAVLAMMSAGKAQECRHWLIEKGLLCGRVVKDPGYPQPVWHLSIPDLWPRNIAWRQENQSLRGRIDLKREQRADLKRQREKERSPGESSQNEKERSPGEKGTSPGEKGTSPGEKGTSPGETKNNHKENQLEDPEGEQALIWKKCQDRLFDALSRPIYETWVEGTRLADLRRENGGYCMSVICPSAYVCDYLSTRLDVLVRRTLAGVLCVYLSNVEVSYCLHNKPAAVSINT